MSLSDFEKQKKGFAKRFESWFQIPPQRRRFWILSFSLAGLLLFFTIIAGYIGYVTFEIDLRIEQLQQTKGTRFFAKYPEIKAHEVVSWDDFLRLLNFAGFLPKRNSESLVPGEYSFSRSEGMIQLFIHRPAFTQAGFQLKQERYQLTLQPKEVGKQYEIVEIVAQNARERVETLGLPPKQMASFVAGRIRTQRSIPLSEIPSSMRLAVMAIEDAHFLEHPGVSLRGMLRALWNDLRTRRFAQGGSTITQQLMKNLFFSREKAVSRKIKEAVFAFITESRHSKEAILEAYLNEVYLGQLSTHEIHGVAEGAQYFFNRPASEITLPQAALLAAIIQAPAIYDPRKNPEKAIKRRNLVLTKMLEHGFIDETELAAASKEPIGVLSQDLSADGSDYFLDLTINSLSPEIKDRLEKEALVIYTTLNPLYQLYGYRSVQQEIDRIEKGQTKKKPQDLQAALIAVQVPTGKVLSVIGGKSYRQSQFNRVSQAKRQPGSLFKPFVYLTAIMQSPDYNPSTLIDDSPFEWKYEGQNWQPKNYDNKFRGAVNLQHALENSLNVPTARLAQAIGISPIRDTLLQAGVSSNVPNLPSIALGSAEVTPLEMANAFTTLANLGVSSGLSTINEIYHSEGELIFTSEMIPRQNLPRDATFILTQMLRGTIQRGTAQWMGKSGVDLSKFSGKTGTTNDAKDAWFVGFSKDLLVLVWVGYDEKEKLGLTGASAAAPIWLNFIRKALPFMGEPTDYEVPDDVEKGNCLDDIPIYYKKGARLSDGCS